MALSGYAPQKYEKGDTFAPSQNEDKALAVRIVELTEPFETEWTKKNETGPKPAVKVHVVELTSRRPVVHRHVAWFDQHHDVLKREVENGRLEIGKTYVMKFGRVQKIKTNGTYCGFVVPEDGDYEAGAKFEAKHGDIDAFIDKAVGGSAVVPSQPAAPAVERSAEDEDDDPLGLND